MPELPEVEVWRIRLSRSVLRRAIVAVEIHAPEMVEGSSVAALTRALLDARFCAVNRRGKFTILETNRSHQLIVHLGMSGSFDVRDDPTTPPHTKMLLRFRGRRRLAYTNERHFGLIRIARHSAAVRGIRDLGPEPLDDALTSERFRDLLLARRRPLKPLLIDQHFIAGLGNVYADEILFQCGLRPDRRASELTYAQVKDLHETMRTVLREAILLEADAARMPASWLTPRRDEEGADCPRCGLPLVQTSFGKRATTFCRRCQK